MDSFLSLKQLHPSRGLKCENVNRQVVQKIESRANYFWPPHFGGFCKNIFCEDLYNLKKRIDTLLESLHFVNECKKIVKNVQKNKQIDNILLESLFQHHENFPISENLSRLFEFLRYGRMDDTEDDEFDNSEHNELYCYNNRKKTKRKQINIYELCLNDLKHEEERLKIVENVKKNRDEYSITTTLLVLNTKTSNDWNIVSKVLSFL